MIPKSTRPYLWPKNERGYTMTPGSGRSYPRHEDKPLPDHRWVIKSSVGEVMGYAKTAWQACRIAALIPGATWEPLNIPELK